MDLVKTQSQELVVVSYTCTAVQKGKVFSFIIRVRTSVLRLRLGNNRLKIKNLVIFNRVT